jgi:hypothetical protein
MATTSAQLIAWLKSNTARRCVLMEVGVQIAGVEQTMYLSDKGYTTKSTESPANTYYKACISGGVSFTETLSLSGETTFSSGVIEFDNFSGELDVWQEYVWQNRNVQIYIGDMSWARTDYYKIFDGVVARPDCTDRMKFQLILGDKLAKINSVVSEAKLGGSTTNKDKLIPLLFGECFNISPLLTNLATHEYQIHNGAVERIIEVRDNGIPLANDTIGWTAVTRSLSTGKFTLNQQPVGTITCDAQGDKPSTYVADAVGLIKRIVKDFGTASQRFTDADLDLTSLATFAAANIQTLGLYLTEKASVVDCCNRLASSIGSRVAMTRGGLMYIVKLSLPQASAGTTVTAADMRERSLAIIQLIPIVAAIKLAYDKNWTVQTALQTGIPDNHIETYAQEWLTNTKIDSTVATKYKLYTDVNQIETLMKSTTEVETENTRLMVLWGTQRRIASYGGLPHLMLEQLGSPQTIAHPRFGLSAGVRGQIISITTKWLEAEIEMSVLI